MNGINFNANYSNYQNFNQVPKQDPDSYAQKYAQENNLSLEDAKAELKSKFGDPSEGANVPFLGQQDNVSIFSASTNENEYASIGGNFNDNLNDIIFGSDFGGANLDLETLTGGKSTTENSFLKNILNLFGNHDDAKASGSEKPDKLDPDKYAEEYAEENNITVEEAKKELKAKYGEPKKEETESNPFSFS